MTDLQQANELLLKKQMDKGRPEPINELVKRAKEIQAAPFQEMIERPRRIVPRASLSDLQTTHPVLRGAVDMVYRWRNRKQDGYQDASLVLVGPYGTGKTHIARAVLWSIAYAVDGEPIAPAGRFYTAADLMLKLTPVQSDFGTIEIPRPSSFIGNAPIVVIDDVGSEQRIPFIAAEMQQEEIQARYFRVIDYCYQWQISLVITSNLSLPALERHLGGRCWDRLCQMAPKGFMYDLTGVPSWRQKASGRN